MKNIYNLIFEQDENVDTPETPMKATSTKIRARDSADSVDDQIDGLILRYETASIREEKLDSLTESLFNKSLKYLIEQEDTADPLADLAGEDPAGGEAAGGDTEPEEAPTPVGSEKMEVEAPEDQIIPDLDIDAFAGRTVRLISNYKSLLSIEEAIINRVKNFLDENYGEKFVSQYIDILDEQYGISIEEFKDERQTEDENFAVGAFAGGTGGLGGGGG